MTGDFVFRLAIPIEISPEDRAVLERMPLTGVISLEDDETDEDWDWEGEQ